MSIILQSSQGPTAPLPTRLFSARDIAELALQRIGAYSPMDSAADDTEMRRALEWMELGISDLAGRKRCQWLIPATITFALEADTPSYVLADVMGSAVPSLGVAYAISAKTIDANSAERNVDVIRRDDFEAFTDKTTSGDPDFVYLDRLVNDGMIYTYPVKTGSTALSLRLVVMTYPRSVLGPIGEAEPAGDVEHGFDRTWQLWLVHSTAALIGAGPVRRLRKQDLDEIKEARDRSEAALMTFHNRETVSLKLRRTRRRDW